MERRSELKGYIWTLKGKFCFTSRCFVLKQFSPDSPYPTIFHPVRTPWVASLGNAAKIGMRVLYYCDSTTNFNYHTASELPFRQN